jgi:hypothetical protein
VRILGTVSVLSGAVAPLRTMLAVAVVVDLEAATMGLTYGILDAVVRNDMRIHPIQEALQRPPQRLLRLR